MVAKVLSGLITLNLIDAFRVLSRMGFLYLLTCS